MLTNQWREMERVDVEITPWMPQDVKRALDQALAEEHNAAMTEHHEMELQLETMKHEMRQARQRAQQLEETLHAADEERSKIEIKSRSEPSKEFLEKPLHTKAPTIEELRRLGSDIPLDQLIKNYICLMASDKRNIAVAVLSVLVLVLCMGFTGRPTSKPLVLDSVVSRSALSETFSTQSMPTPIMSSLSAQIQQDSILSTNPSSMSQTASMPSADPEVTGSTNNVSDTAAALQIAPSTLPELALA